LLAAYERAFSKMRGRSAVEANNASAEMKH